MIQVKTPDGYKLPDNIFYKNGSTFVQVKKVYSNQRVLERTAICSCELGTSKLIKSLRALIVTYTDLIKYTAEPEKTELIDAVASMENEIESLKIDQLIYNQQLTIIDNDRDLRNQVIPAVYGVNLLTEYVINNTPNAQIAVKIVVGNNTVNPDIEFSPLPANMFKYNGDYYYVGNQSDQTTILENITNIFGDGKVALQVYSANELINILRVTVTEKSALNIAQLRKIAIQQDLIDSAVSARRLKVLIDSTLEDSNTDSAVKAFYEVASITDVVDGNITSTTIKMNVDLRMSNLLPATKLDIKTPLFPFTLEALNLKTDEILGYTNTVKNVNVSPVVSPSAMTQIYTSSDIHEFKFDKMGRVSTGVKAIGYNDITLLETHKHSYITSEKDNTLCVLSANVKVYIDITVRDNVITEIFNRVKSLEESVKLSTNIRNIISPVSDTITTSPMKVAFESSKGRRVISEVGNTICLVPENVSFIPTTNETKRYIISQLSDKINSLTTVIKTKSGIKYDGTSLIETEQHSKIITQLSNNVCNMQENVFTTALAHTRIISNVSDEPYIIGDVIATAVSHPELATPESDVIQLTTGKVKLSSVIIPIISNVESPIINVIENVKVVNDPIPFTVYQQSVGVVKQFDKPIIEPSSIDIYVSSVKNIGAMSRIDPITVISDKIPNYISTQTNMTSEIIVTDDTVDSVKTIDSYVVSQLSLSLNSNIVIPKCDVQAIEIYVAESKSNNIASFDTIVKLNAPDVSNYIVTSISENIASFDSIMAVANTASASNAIIDVKANKTISFDISGSVIFTNDSNDKVIDVKSNKTISFDENLVGIMNFNNESNDKIIDVKSNKVLTFNMDVDTSLNSGTAPFIISNGLLYSSTQIDNMLVVSDTLDGKNYVITRDATGIIESFETTQPVTNNNYFYDEITKLTYKVTSTGGFLDMVAM